MRHRLSSLVPVLALLSTVALPVLAEEPPAQLLARLLAPTPIVADLAELTDSIGGRPTGSPALDRAVE